MDFKENETLAIVHFGELWLKGRNRSEYIRRLERNASEQLAGESFVLQRHYDRLLMRFDSDSDIDAIRSKLARVFGLSGFEIAIATEPRVSKIVTTASAMLKSRAGAKCVKINSHRSDKTLPFTSLDIIKKLKHEVGRIGLTADTREYDTELNVNVTKEAAFIYFNKEKGLGGLPVGSSGKGVILMSGGIDSPVSAWYAMKRGVEPVYVHLHAFQTSDEAIKGKVTTIINTLSRFYPHYKAYFVPSHIFQAKSSGFGRYELILLKAFMLRLAERVAKKEGAYTIFTGESLGQVASQTPGNLCAEQYGIKTPILRPLIGYDKEDIIRVAREIGTYQESIKPYKDVCSINARNPKLSARVEDVRDMLKQMKIQSIVSRSLRLAKIISA